MVGWSLRGQCTQLSQGALCRRSSASLWKKKVRVFVCVSRASILTLQVLEESLCGAGAGQGRERGCADLGRTASCRTTASG